MRATPDSSRTESPLSEDDIDLEPAADIVDGALPGDGMATSTLRSRLAVVAGFLALFHLVFAVVKMTGPDLASVSASDAPTWTLLLRAGVAGIVFALLRSPLRLHRGHLRVLEVCLFGIEMLIMLAAQYLSAVDLIDRGDLIDAVAVQKNGVIRTIVLGRLRGKRATLRWWISKPRAGY
jgi:hypothetical protein